MKNLGPVEILKDLVAFPSISKTSNLDLVEYLAQNFARAGFETTKILSEDEPKRASLLCRIGPDVEGGLMLSGHTDVVPVANQAWETDPFLLAEKDNKLFGRGSVDMKGFIAATCSALIDFPLSQLKKPLTLLWTYDEEVGCAGSAQAAPLLLQHMRYLPKAAIIGEPTDFNILRMHTGHVTVRINVKGKGVHSSDPDLGISAIKGLTQALNGLFALENELKEEVSFEGFFKRPFVTLNVGEVHGGTAVNIVPDSAFAMVGFRPLPDTSIDRTCTRIEEACMRYQTERQAKLTLSIEKITPAMITKADTELEKSLRPFANNHGPCSAQFSTDGGNINNVGIECLIFGPGSIDVAHQANEWIGKPDLLLAKEKLKGIISRWFL